MHLVWPSKQFKRAKLKSESNSGRSTEINLKKKITKEEYERVKNVIDSQYLTSRPFGQEK